MGLGGTLLWPVHWFAAWADDNPLRAAGVIVAAGATAALMVSVGMTTTGHRSTSRNPVPARRSDPR